MTVTYCIQCGKLGRPTVATGVDMEGDPACNVHRDLSVEPTTPEKRIRAHNAPTAGSRFASKVCACGCGEYYVPTGTKQRFARGHKPKRTANASRAILKQRTAAAAVVPSQCAAKADLAILKAELQKQIEAIEIVELLLAK